MKKTSMEISVSMRAITFFHNESQPSEKIDDCLVFRRDKVYYSKSIKMGKKALFIKNSTLYPPVDEILAETGFEVDVATGRESGLRQLIGQTHDVVVVMDSNGSESWQFCQIIRSITTIPLIVINANASPEACARAIYSGADFFMRKPFGPLEFLARVNSLMERPVYRQAMPIGQ
jgi:CheY-like chemotaxis protein